MSEMDKTGLLSESSIEMLRDLCDFTEKSKSEVIEEALYHLGRVYGGTEYVPGEEPDPFKIMLKKMVAAMRKYEMDVDEEPPYEHRKMMGEAEKLLANTGGEE